MADSLIFAARYQAQMAKLVDALSSGGSAARCAGSNPVLGTNETKPAFLAGFVV